LGAFLFAFFVVFIREIRMVNKNYRRGREKEYNICRRLRSERWDIVQRSAGSHSAIDVFAIKIKEKKIILIQSKVGDVNLDDYKDLIEGLNGKFEVVFEVE